MVYKYIDVSRYNGTIDWEQVKASGVQGAFLKTVSTNYSQFGGLYIDPTFERNYAECKRVGIPVGVYYYTYATTKEYAQKELAMFKKAVWGKSFELPLVVDVEDNLLKPLSKERLTDLVIFALDEIQSWGAYRMLYSYLNYESTELDMTRIIGKYDHWLAAYIQNKPAGEYSIWQWTSNGNVPGITGRTDLNRVYMGSGRTPTDTKTYPEIISAAGLNNFTGEPVPTPIPPEEKVSPISPNPIKLVIGYISSGDIACLNRLLDNLLVTHSCEDGYVYTSEVSSGDQVTLIKWCNDMGVPIREFKEPAQPEEKVDPISATPIRLVIGPVTTEAGLKPLEDELNKLSIPFDSDDGYIYTEQVSSGDQVSIIRLCKERNIGVKEFVSVIIHNNEPIDIVEPGVEIDPPDEPTPPAIKKSWLTAILEFIFKIFGGSK